MMHRSVLTVIKLSSTILYTYSKIVQSEQSEQSIYLIQFSDWLFIRVLVHTHAHKLYGRKARCCQCVRFYDNPITDFTIILCNYHIMLIWVICLLGFSSRELAVPDISMVHGRMLVCAWETGLEEVSDTAVKLIMQSIEVGLVMGWGKRGGGENLMYLWSIL